MGRRRSKRKNVHIEAEIISGDDTYSGVIENISEHGINIETSSKELLSTSTRFNPGTEFGIKFQTPSGEIIRLHCTVKWSFKTAPHGLKRKVGFEIIFPPPEYIDFYRS